MFGFKKLNELVLNIGLYLKPPLVSRLANWKLPITVFSSSMRRVCQNVLSYAKKIYVCVVKGQFFCPDLRRANTNANFVKVLIRKLRKAAVSNQTLETRPPPVIETIGSVYLIVNNMTLHFVSCDPGSLKCGLVL